MDLSSQFLIWSFYTDSVDSRLYCSAIDVLINSSRMSEKRNQPRSQKDFKQNVKKTDKTA